MNTFNTYEKIYFHYENNYFLEMIISWKYYIENFCDYYYHNQLFLLNVPLYLQSTDVKNIRGWYRLQMTFFIATDKYHVTCNYLNFSSRCVYIIPAIAKAWICFTIMEIFCKYKCISSRKCVAFMAPRNNIWYRSPLNENLIRRHPATQLVQFSR